jgi:hypothetical protein
MRFSGLEDRTEEQTLPLRRFALFGLVGLLALSCALPLRAEQASPCKVLDPELQAEYRGECRGELAHGKGTARGIATYEGEFRRGMKHGKGVKTWAWGDRYEGAFKNDRKHGRGVYTWGVGTQWAGERYEGEFKDDYRDGVGVYTWPNGDRFDGPWVKDQRQGYAAMEARQNLARVAQLEAFKPGVSVCWLGAAAKPELGVVKGSVDSFDGARLNVKLVELPAGITQGRQGLHVGQVVVEDPVQWTPCL